MWCNTGTLRNTNLCRSDRPDTQRGPRSGQSHDQQPHAPVQPGTSQNSVVVLVMQQKAVAHHKQAACSTHLTGQRCGIGCAAHVAVLQDDNLPVLHRTCKAGQWNRRVLHRSSYTRSSATHAGSVSAADCTSSCPTAPHSNVLQARPHRGRLSKSKEPGHGKTVRWRQFADGHLLCSFIDSHWVGRGWQRRRAHTLSAQ